MFFQRAIYISLEMLVKKLLPCVQRNSSMLQNCIYVYGNGTVHHLSLVNKTCFDWLCESIESNKPACMVYQRNCKSNGSKKGIIYDLIEPFFISPRNVRPELDIKNVDDFS